MDPGIKEGKKGKREIIFLGKEIILRLHSQHGFAGAFAEAGC